MSYSERRRSPKWTDQDAEYMKENFPKEGSKCFNKYRENGVSYDQCRYYVISLGLITNVVKKNG